MANPAGLVVQWAGVTVGALTLLDWALADSQKKAVKSWAETAWIWLGDRKPQSYLNTITAQRNQWPIALLLALLLAVASTVPWMLISITQQSAQRYRTMAHQLSQHPPDTQHVFRTIQTNGLITSSKWREWEESRKANSITIGWTSLVISCLFYMIFIHKKIINFLASDGSFWRFGLRLLLLSICCCSLMFALSQALSASIDSLYGSVWWMAPLGVLAAPYVVYAYLLIVWVLWLGGIMFLRGVVCAAQFVTLRIASYEKGPLLGLSAALVAVGLIMKPIAG